MYNVTIDQAIKELKNRCRNRMFSNYTSAVYQVAINCMEKVKAEQEKANERSN